MRNLMYFLLALFLGIVIAFGLATIGCDFAFDNSKDTITQPSINPTVEISASAISGTAPLAVTFTAVTYGGQAPYQYLWEIDGIGKIADRKTISYIFTVVGKYIIFVTVTDGYGRSAQGSIIIEVL